jgi:FAD:protein FMN transferase
MAAGPSARRSVPDVEGRLGIETLREVRRFSHEAMNTVFEVYAVHPDQEYAAQAAQAAFEVVDRLERELSRFLPNSDIAKINRLAAGDSTLVGASTLECLTIARHMFALTDGAFDVSIGTGLPSLDLDADEVQVRATRDGVHLDLGGIGKGYAVDVMADLLEEWELRIALVHGGFSSVLALDPPDGCDGWPLTLSEPGARPRLLDRLSVRQTALAASGVRKGDHIIEPTSGEPVRGRRAAWVALPRPATKDVDLSGGAMPAGDVPRIATAAVSDALTTAAMLMTAENIVTLCERHPGLEVWLLPEAESGASDGAALRHFGGGRPDSHAPWSGRL